MLRTVEKDLTARAQALLADSPIFAHREIVVEREGETLTLFGSVDTFYHKQMAQEMIRELIAEEDCRVVNCVQVDYGDARRIAAK